MTDHYLSSFVMPVPLMSEANRPWLGCFSSASDLRPSSHEAAWCSSVSWRPSFEAVTSWPATAGARRSRPLARMVERAWQVVWEEMRTGAVVTGNVRQEQTEYPPFAVREALVNAICHRDYRLRGRPIEVRMFDDRLEVISPGGLPGYITVDNMVEEHFSRNPRIVAGLFQWGYIEELGLGIDRMMKDMLRAGHRAPVFRATPYSFTVTLHNVRELRMAQDWGWSMNERQLRAMHYLRQEGSIANREYRALCPDISAETIRLDLADLTDRGLILKMGTKKRGTYYILK